MPTMFIVAYVLGGIVFLAGFGAALALKQLGKADAYFFMSTAMMLLYLSGVYIGFEKFGLIAFLPPFAMTELAFYGLGVDWQGTQACAQGYNC